MMVVRVMLFMLQIVLCGECLRRVIIAEGGGRVRAQFFYIGFSNESILIGIKQKDVILRILTSFEVCGLWCWWNSF